MMPMEKVEVLRACCCVAGAGGQTAESERRVLEKLAHDVGVGRASLDAMIERGETDPDFYKEQFQVLKSNPAVAMSVLVQTAMSDGQVTEDELAVLQGLATNLGMEQQAFQQLIDNRGQYDAS